MAAPNAGPMAGEWCCTGTLGKLLAGQNTDQGPEDKPQGLPAPKWSLQDIAWASTPREQTGSLPPHHGAQPASSPTPSPGL